jgi:hypothetical protein
MNNLKCDQCDNSAMFTIGPNETAVCLNCYKIWKQITIDEMNMVHREMQWADKTLLETLGFQPNEPAINNIGINMGNVNHIINSTVGVVNNGEIRTNSIKIAIDSLEKNNQKEIAYTLKELSNFLLNVSSFSDAQKKSTLELIEFIAEEANKPSENRKKGLIFEAIVKLETFFSLLTNGPALWSKYGPYLIGFFS